MAVKPTAPRVMNGKWGMVYLDGEPVYETDSYEAKIKIEREDVDFVMQTAFECVEPMEIVEKVFEPGEIPQIAVECLKLAGYVDGVKAVDDIKN